MRAVKPQVFGVASGTLRTFANIGMVFSFSMAILVASWSISRGLAFVIFVGTAKIKGHLAVAIYCRFAHSVLHLHGRHGPRRGLLGHQSRPGASRTQGRQRLPHPDLLGLLQAWQGFLKASPRVLPNSSVRKY